VSIAPKNVLAMGGLQAGGDLALSSKALGEDETSDSQGPKGRVRGRKGVNPGGKKEYSREEGSKKSRTYIDA